MKIYDCFMYSNEKDLLDLRLKYLDKYVDYFVIVESCFNHKGEKRKLLFNHTKYKRFKNKIIYLVYKKTTNLKRVHKSVNEIQKALVESNNAWLRENGQRNFIENGLNNAMPNDIILISDVDEIPNLENIDFNRYKEKVIQFRQEMFYYKFNLKLPNLIWTGTKGCKKKDLITPQWLRNIKDKKYPLFRIDTILSKTKYISVRFMDNGGWHFSNIKSAKEIEHKLKSYLHHREFDINPLSLKKIEEIIKNKIAIYDLTLDKKAQKIGEGNKLEKYPLNKLPKFLQNNLNYYKKWID